VTPVFHLGGQSLKGKTTDPRRKKISHRDSIAGVEHNTTTLLTCHPPPPTNHHFGAQQPAQHALLKLIDEAQDLCTAVGKALHVGRDVAAAQAALYALNAHIDNARALHSTHPLQPTETDTRNSAAELEDVRKSKDGGEAKGG
jgi:hypothetical protein